MTESEAELAEAISAFTRAETLRTQGRVAGAAYDTAESTLRRAEARVGRARNGSTTRGADAIWVSVRAAPSITRTGTGCDQRVGGLGFET